MGVPKKAELCCLRADAPGKMGRPVIISAKMQPTLQMSTGVEYLRDPSRTSGARYLARGAVEFLLPS